MTAMVRLCGILLVAAAGTGYAQTPLAAGPSEGSDSTMQNVVTAFSVRSGRIALSSAANPGPAYLPDGTYTNEGGTTIVILEGRIVRLQRSSGELTEIATVHANRQRGILLTPSTNALMAVSDVALPSGTFKSEDGAASITVVAGRPTEFTIPAKSPEH